MTRVDQAVPPGRILRYNFSERITHWVAAISYIYLMLTGLAFWSPWLFWIAVILGGAPVSRMLHPWIGLIFVGSVTLMYGMWAPQMKSTDTDRQWWKSIGNYVQNRDDKMPPAGRYNAGQKLLFWSFFLAGLVLFVTGLVLWLPEYIPWSLRWLRYLAVFLHPVAALMTIANFLIHIYMSVFAERGALDSMIHGDVSEHFVERYHPGWYREIARGSSTPRK
jgi:formate dehydrogenase subunit gamma